MSKEVRIFLKGDGKKEYLKLKERNDKDAKSILKSFERVKETLRKNPHYGQPIAKNKIPKKYLDLGIKNLYRAEISNFWRILYTIEGNKIEILLFILNIVDHPTYNKLLRYKKK